MARNAEKAQTMLNRFMEMRKIELGLKKEDERRPFHTMECENLSEAERWRRQVIQDITKRVSQIQNAGLGEFRIRELNDEINKYFREKRHWEERIKQLGGPDYRKVGPRLLDNEGLEIPGQGGYKYFGAAKDLPGVRELFEVVPPENQQKNRAALYKNIDADYYGYRDDDDGQLIALESEKEKELLELEGTKNNETTSRSHPVALPNGNSADLFENLLHSQTAIPLKHSVEIPTSHDVEQYLLEKRKQALLDRIMR